MRQLILTFILFLNFFCANAQDNKIDPLKIKADLNEILSDLASSYAYLDEKNVDLNCIRDFYEKQIPDITSYVETVLFFEYLLDEFYDSHLNLGTNTNSSFRLFAPIYLVLEDGKPIVSNVWQNQIENLEHSLIGAELLKINGLEIDAAIKQFPTHCNDKNSKEVREWIVNKLVAGRYNQSRVLTLKLKNNKTIEFDVDELKIKPNSNLLTSTTKNGIGIITINNSLGNNSLINEFDKALDSLMHTKGLIIDLRNTVDGGNSYVARGIMGRFISETKPYQQHVKKEKYQENPMIVRSWIEYVDPRKQLYTKPVVILVGRWTGSMGEGLAIGFEGMDRAEIVGSAMERLAGEIDGFSFRNQRFGYRISTAKLFHLNGTARERYIPTNFVIQTTTDKDEILEKGVELLN